MSKSIGVVYKPFKSELDEDKVIILNEDGTKVEKRQKHCFFKTRQKAALVICSGIVAFLILSGVFHFVIDQNSSKKCPFEKFVSSDTTNENMSCSFFQSVKQIEIVLTQDSHSSCIDTFTCISLIHETVQHYSDNNLRYNFLVSSDFRLILVFGHSCSAVSSLNNEVDFTISYIKNSQISERSSGNISRKDARSTLELIYHGIKCNGNQSNLTMTSLCVDGCKLSDCGSAFEEEIEWLEDLVLDESYTSHGFNFETTHASQENLKWSVCEEPVKDVVLPHPKKLSWESLASNSCMPYEPVDHISVEVVEVPYMLSCVEKVKCGLFSNIIEEKHDGLKYNFILAHYGSLYVGTGFHCSTNDTHPKSLRIKVLRSSPTNIVNHFQEMRRISEIINHGVNCGKIWKNYSISDDCSVSSCFPKYENISHDMVTILSTGYGRYGNEIGHDAHVGESHKSIPYNKLWVSSASCHHKQHSSSSLKTETVDMNNKTFLPDQYSAETATVQASFNEMGETTTANVITVRTIADPEADYDWYDEYY